MKTLTSSKKVIFASPFRTMAMQYPVTANPIRGSSSRSSDKEVPETSVREPFDAESNAANIECSKYMWFEDE